MTEVAKTGVRQPASRRVRASGQSHEKLDDLLRTRRVLLVVGSGGVGKTTTSAALALAAAKAGRKVLCLTIDPAKRLANSLGLPEMTSEETLVSSELFAQAGTQVSGSLTVMMLDTKRTFDDLVRRHASSAAAREAILQNRIYQYVSTSLAGTKEYMAMEKLELLRATNSYDLIVLDTPPTTHALDFLDAPERMVEAIDSPAMRWFLQAFGGKGGRGRLAFDLLGKGSQLVLKAVAKITGAGFLEQLAAFIAAMNDLFGGFTERAKRVSEALRGPEVAFVLVTSPDPMAIEEINYFADRLRSLAMPRDIFVVNRVHLAPPPEAEDRDAVRDALIADGLPSDDAAVRTMVAAAEEARALAARDARHIDRLDTPMASGAPKGPHRPTNVVGRGSPSADHPAPIVQVPAFERDVHDVRMLLAVAEALVDGAGLAVDASIAR